MCDKKIDIPFVTQEKQIYPLNDESYSNYRLDKLDISYNDPTTLQPQKFKNTPLLELKTNGKTIMNITGDICDLGDRLEMKGTLQLENVISGPYRTEGGIIQFQRLFLHFDQLTIPIQIIYPYDIQKICNSSVNDPSQLDVKLDKSSGSKILFEKFFVTNGLSETNRNEIFSGLTEEFRDPNGTFSRIYDNFISGLKNSEFFGLIEKELNRIICLSKNNGEQVDKKDLMGPGPFIEPYSFLFVSDPSDMYLSPSSRYKEKLTRLKDNGDLNLIIK